MAAILFPSSPSTGDIYTNNGYSWRWDGTVWEAIKVPQQGAFTLGTLNGGDSNASNGSYTVTTVENIGLPSPYGNRGSFIGSNGNVWVLTDNVRTLGVGTSSSGTTGEIRATNNITAYFSDERLKTKLGNIENALEKLMTLDGFYYQANETAQALGYEPKKEVGVSAQQVEKVMPEVVAPAPIDSQYLTVRYEKLVPLLIEAIKEMSLEIKEIKASLNK
jgi:hypothetical protein